MWDHVCMMSSSNGNIFRVTGPLWGKSIGHRWITLTRPMRPSFDVFFDLHLNKQLSKESKRRWLETPSHSSWRHCNGQTDLKKFALCPRPRVMMIMSDFDIPLHCALLPSTTAPNRHHGVAKREVRMALWNVALHEVFPRVVHDSSLLCWRLVS